MEMQACPTGVEENDTFVISWSPWIQAYPNQSLAYIIGVNNKFQFFAQILILLVTEGILTYTIIRICVTFK